MKKTTDKYLSVINNLYAGCFDEDTFLRSTRAVGEVLGSHINHFHIQIGNNIKYASSNVEVNGLQEYIDYYGKIDFRVLAAFSTIDLAEKCYNLDCFYEQKQLLESEIYNDFSLKWDVPKCIFTPLHQTFGGTSFIAFLRGQSQCEITGDDLRKMDIFAPHLRNILCIQQKFNLLENNIQNLRKTFDHLSFGVLILNTEQKITYANRFADILLAKSNSLTISQYKLHARHVTENKNLQYTIKKMIDMGRGKNFISPNILPIKGGYDVSLIGEMPISLYFIPNQADGFADIHGVTILMNAPCADQDTASKKQFYKTLFNLSNRQVDVLVGLMKYDNHYEIAEALGISKDTLKSHLKEIYARTNTNNARDLLKLLNKIQV